jgi:hypothetical protein
MRPDADTTKAVYLWMLAGWLEFFVRGRAQRVPLG